MTSKKRPILLCLALVMVMSIIMTACSENPTKLATPANLSISNKVVTWDPVPNAAKYSISVDGTATEVTVTSYTLTVTAVKTYEIKVKAIAGSAFFSDSDWAETSFEIKANVTVSFDANEGDDINPITAAAESALTLPVASRTNYLFAGWYSDDDLTEPFTATTMPTSDITLYARWIADPVEVFNFTTIEIGEEDEKATVRSISGLTPFGASLTTIEIPSQISGKDVVVIGNSAFMNNKTMTSVIIPETVTTIGSSAFSNTSITSVVIPDSITTIGASAFSSVAVIIVESATPAIQSSAFEKSKLFVVPAAAKSAYTTEWASYASKIFGDDEVDVADTYVSRTDDGVTTLLAYFGASESFNLPAEIDVIGANAFSSNTLLKSINLGSTLTEIGAHAFNYCGNLTEISIPASVTTIGDYALTTCKIVTMEAATPIANIRPTSAFSTGVLAAVLVPSVEAEAAYINNDTWGKAFYTPDFLGERIHSITHKAGDRIVNGTNFALYLGSAENFSIPNGIEKIGYAAFRGNTTLKSVTILDSVTAIAAHAFSTATNLESVTMGASVATIGDNAFLSCSKLLEIDLPASITSIGNSVFGNVKTVKIAATTPPTISSTAFSTSSTDFRVIVPTTSLTSYHAATNWSNFKAKIFSVGQIEAANTNGGFIIDSSNVLTAYIGTNAVISIPAGVVEIGESVFSGNTLITSVTIPDSVITINRYAFSGCSNLETVDFGAGVEYIYNEAFAHCTKLTSISLPASIKQIGGGGSSYAAIFPSVLTVRVAATTPPMLSLGYSTTFGMNSNASFKIIVPDSAVETYKAALGWSYGSAKIFGESTVS